MPTAFLYNTKTPGQLAYEADIARMPTYHDGKKRPTWEELDPYAKPSWEKNPTPRSWDFRNVRDAE